MRLAPAKVELEKRRDGSLLLRSPQKLAPYARCVTEWLVQWSDRAPTRTFLAERAGDGWRKIAYREAYGAVRRIGQALLDRGLGADKPVAILSGGQKTRALLARLLLESPDLLILDEPTNHLDIHAVEWLEGWLNEWNGAVLIVSHDRYFLDQVVGTIWELEFGRLTEYRGNYSA